MLEEHRTGRNAASRAPVLRIGVAAVTALLAAVPWLTTTGSTRAASAAPSSQEDPSSQGCGLQSSAGKVSHVINLVFDNVHFSRDNPDVPSDLEQMPNLFNFIKQNGVLLSDMHTPLIAHTADDILTTLTGVYGDKHGQPVSNSYRVFNTDGSSSSASSFTYWTDPVANSKTTDTLPTMVDSRGKIAPAPWVPFTRAGCDVGGFSTANIEVENANPDLKSIYGVTSPQWQAVLADQAAHGGFADLSNADYQGIAVHCAKTSSSVCARNPSLAAPDRLPDEPGGYNGYSALYGNLNVGPVIGGQAVPGHGVKVNDLDGQPLTNGFASADVTNPAVYYGFPGFTVTPAQTLAYVAGMQENGIPVTYGYISLAHGNDARALGPGEAEYVANLKKFDASFGQFFARMSKDGITPANTVFVVSTDEGDHLAGTQHPTPSGCTGVTTPCTYAKGTLGEVTVSLAGLLKEQFPGETSSDYAIHSDSAPNFYINGNPPAGSARARRLEQEMAALLAPDPYANHDTGATVPVTRRMADQVEEKILHMQTSDPNRTPTFTDFANPDFFITPGSASKPCPAASPSQTATSDPCVLVDPTFAWNHGDVGQDINTMWAGLVGPGITARGVDAKTWADETDLRPTVMALTGLKDDYGSDGRTLWEEMSVTFSGSTDDANNREALLGLARAYKQLNADVGVFGLSTLAASSAALMSTAPGDALYKDIESRLVTLGNQRDALAGRISAMLNGVDSESAADTDKARELTAEANDLIVQAAQLGYAG